MTYEEVIARLQKEANPDNVAGMARFGINASGTLGISVIFVRGLAKEIGKDHELAGKLWKSGIHEAKILASIIDVPSEVTEAQADDWVKDLDSWDTCDQLCGNLLVRPSFAHEKAKEWAVKEEEFVRRAGFSLMAYLTVHDKKAENSKFLAFLPFIEEYAQDERNFVKKAVNWALRQIGKRNLELCDKALELAVELSESSNKAARWIGKDAARELNNRRPALAAKS